MFDLVLHQPIRCNIIALLIANEEEPLPFKEIKNKFNLTEGNLSSHLSKLEKEEYITIEKSFENKRPKTSVSVTKKGVESFKEYIKQLRKFVGENEVKVKRM